MKLFLHILMYIFGAIFLLFLIAGMSAENENSTGMNIFIGIVLGLVTLSIFVFNIGTRKVVLKNKKSNTTIDSDEITTEVKPKKVNTLLMVFGVFMVLIGVLMTFMLIYLLSNLKEETSTVITIYGIILIGSIAIATYPIIIIRSSAKKVK